MEPTELIQKCSRLKSSWTVRDKKIRDWYKILRLKDTLKQEGMESVVSNDPKTGYNLAKHLLITSIISHKIESDELSAQEIASTSYLEGFLTKIWDAEGDRYRKTGRQKFTTKLCGFLLSTGWYSIFAMATQDKLWADVWNPIEVYPLFGNQGLLEVAHIYRLSPAEIKLKARLMKVELKNIPSHNMTGYDYWGYDDDGDAINAIILGTEYIKKPEKDVAINRIIQALGEPVIPVFVSPVSGLPDEGSIVGGKDWQENFGEAIVATNESMTLTYNKMLSFIQQTARSAAQHRWFDKTSGDTAILTEENVDKFGAIYHLGPNDEVGAVESPAIPVELRTAMFEYSNMIQRGLFPWVLHGNLQQQLSYLAMANVASSALQQLTPYVEGLEGAFTDINNFWYNMIAVNGFNPDGYKIPKNMPAKVRLKTTSEVQIPGYLVQRATVAKMLNPAFVLPKRWIMDRMFPEIRDAMRAQAQVREEEVTNHPKVVLVDAIIAYREHARQLRDNDNVDSAVLYEKLADSMEQEIITPQQPTTQPTATTNIPREVMPREAVEPLEGLGGEI